MGSALQSGFARGLGGSLTMKHMKLHVATGKLGSQLRLMIVNMDRQDMQD